MAVIRPTGRRPRLSDAETGELMLAAGMRLVGAQGLSLSLEHLSMEEVIQAAGVSRTSSYRRWPTKDLFAADLLLRLAAATHLAGEIEGLAQALAGISPRILAELDTEQGRRDAVVEALRVVMDTDFRAALDSDSWRPYTTLRVAHMGLPDTDLRARVAAELRHTERRFTQARARSIRLLGELVGYRTRFPDETGWQRLSLTLGAVYVGLLVRGYSDRAAVTEPMSLALFGSSRPAPWSAAAQALVGILLDSLEPDPSVVWDEHRVAELRARFTDIDGTIRQVQSLADPAG